MTYTITARNNSSTTATNVVITDNFAGLPLSNIAWTATGTPNASGSAPTGFERTGTNNINDADITLPGGATITYTVTATVNNVPNNTVIRNTAEIRSTSINDPDPANNQSTDTTTIVTTQPSGGVEIRKTPIVTDVNNNNVIDAGDRVEYVLEVVNAGTTPLAGIQIRDVFPANLLSNVQETTRGINPVENTLTIDVENLEANASQTFRVLATIANNVGANTAITNTATVTGGGSATPLDEISATLTTGQPAPATADLVLRKEVSNAIPTAGSQITYTLTVRNTGPSAATNIEVTDALNTTTLTGINATAPTGTTYTNGVWRIPTLNSGQELSLPIQVTVPASGTINSTSRITATGTPDPITANNQASATVAVGASGIELRGTPNNDLLVGSTGNDTLFSSGGTDTLRGGAGNDLYVFTDAQHSNIDVLPIGDFIEGFNPAQDQIRIAFTNSINNIQIGSINNGGTTLAVTNTDFVISLTGLDAGVTETQLRNAIQVGPLP
ncbi:MAG: DUF11 domain-containing protein [Desertifilum sp.]|nr:DUF11 domain-containing protein [Desertifilum sp.]